jgi:aspartyl protease family protein
VSRFIVIALILVGLALLAPRFAPSLIAGIVDRGEIETIEPAADAPPPAEAGEPSSPPDQGPNSSVEDSSPPPQDTRMVEVFDGRRVSIDADSSGHFVVEARLNGRPVTAMIDTGATVVALTEKTARRIGVFPLRADFTQPVATANGTVRAAPVRVSEIRIGGIVVRNVEAMVVPGDALSVDLLGMSYLSRLAMFESSNGRLVLIK